MIVALYLALVRPQLEYGVQFLAYFKEDVDKAERVQRLTRKMITGLECSLMRKRGEPGRFSLKES